MTLAKLKELCREHGLKVGGNKVDLVARILSHEAEAEAEEEEEEDEEEEEEEEEKKEEVDIATEKTSLDRFTEALDQDNLEDFPLEEIFDLHIPQEGEIVTGQVTSLVEWGAFVELESGWSGLLHVSEITDGFVDNIEDYLHPGQKVEVMVIKHREDRLDRLSLSMRRLHQPPHMQKAIADGRLSPVDPGKQMSPIGRRMDMAEEGYRTLEFRVSALEAVLSQLGYSEALRAAQYEARDGTKRPSVPSIEAMLGSVPVERPPTPQPRNERSAIDMVLKDLRTPRPYEGDGQGEEEEEGDEAPSDAGGSAAEGTAEDDRASAAKSVLEEIKRTEAQRKSARSRPHSAPALEDRLADNFMADMGL